MENEIRCYANISAEAYNTEKKVTDTATEQVIEHSEIFEYCYCQLINGFCCKPKTNSWLFLVCS